MLELVGTMNRGVINTGLCKKAARFARERHDRFPKKPENRFRKYTGEPYFNHVVEVAVLLDWAGEEEHTVCAGFLHDTLEDTETTFFELGEHFGLHVATLVDMVTDVAPPQAGLNRAQRQAIERNHLRGASPEGKSLKLADVCSNTVSIMERDPKFGPVYLEEKRLLLPFLRGGNPLLFAQASHILSKWS
jgi:(p)ppGpp synthase/HD superfamily hydrolase